MPLAGTEGLGGRISRVLRRARRVKRRAGSEQGCEVLCHGADAQLLMMIGLGAGPVDSGSRRLRLRGRGFVDVIPVRREEHGRPLNRLDLRPPAVPVKRDREIEAGARLADLREQLRDDPQVVTVQES